MPLMPSMKLKAFIAARHRNSAGSAVQRGALAANGASISAVAIVCTASRGATGRERRSSTKLITPTRVRPVR